jgi:uncharacterized protein
VESATLGRPLPGRLAGWLVFTLILVGLGYAGQLLGDEQPDDLAYRYETSISAVITLAIMVGILLLIARRLPLREAFALRAPHSWPRALGLSVLALIGIYVASGVLVVAGLDAGEEQGLVPEEWDSSRAGAFAAFFVVASILTPIVEELIYRGIGFTLLAPYGAWVAILVTGLLFGAAHGLVLGLPILVGFGFVLAWLRWKTGSVYPPILLHAVFNAAALVISVTA